MAVDLLALHRSRLFQYSLGAALVAHGLPIPPGARTSAAFAFCRIALERGSGFHVLLEDDNPISAVSLVRLQGEAVLRGVWTLFAASEEWIEEFSSEPKHHHKEPAEFPRVFEMLNDLPNSPADPVLHQSLQGLKDLAWDSLNSYTHGGLRLVKRTLEGFDDELLLWMLKTTNSLTYIASQLLAFIAKDEKSSEALFDIRVKFADCMHALQEPQVGESSS